MDNTRLRIIMLILLIGSASQRAASQGLQLYKNCLYAEYGLLQYNNQGSERLAQYNDLLSVGLGYSKHLFPFLTLGLKAKHYRMTILPSQGNNTIRSNAGQLQLRVQRPAISRTFKLRRWNPYLEMGVGYANEYLNEPIDRTLNEYIYIPLAAGLDFRFNAHWALGVQGEYRLSGKNVIEMFKDWRGSLNTFNAVSARLSFYFGRRTTRPDVLRIYTRPQTNTPVQRVSGPAVRSAGIDLQAKEKTVPLAAGKVSMQETARLQDSVSRQQAPLLTAAAGSPDTVSVQEVNAMPRPANTGKSADTLSTLTAAAGSPDTGSAQGANAMARQADTKSADTVGTLTTAAGSPDTASVRVANAMARQADTGKSADTVGTLTKAAGSPDTASVRVANAMARPADTGRLAGTVGTLTKAAGSPDTALVRVANVIGRSVVSGERPADTAIPAKTAVPVPVTPAPGRDTVWIVQKDTIVVKGTDSTAAKLPESLVTNAVKERDTTLRAAIAVEMEQPVQTEVMEVRKDEPAQQELQEKNRLLEMRLQELEMKNEALQRRVTEVQQSVPVSPDSSKTIIAVRTVQQPAPTPQQPKAVPQQSVPVYQQPVPVPQQPITAPQQPVPPVPQQPVTAPQQPVPVYQQPIPSMPLQITPQKSGSNNLVVVPVPTGSGKVKEDKKADKQMEQMKRNQDSILSRMATIQASMEELRAQKGDTLQAISDADSSISQTDSVTAADTPGMVRLRTDSMQKAMQVQLEVLRNENIALQELLGSMATQTQEESTQPTVEDQTPDLESNIFFSVNQYKLDPPAERQLLTLADSLRSDSSGYWVLLEGFTDKSGNAAYNLKLSEQRVQSVKSFLVQQGVPRQVILEKNFGSRFSSELSNSKDRKVKLTRIRR